MRICFLATDITRRGGIERMVCLLANALCEKHEVSVISLGKKCDTPMFVYDSAVNIIYLKKSQLPKVYLLLQIQQIHNFLKTKKINVLINVDIGIAFHGIPAVMGTKTKVITWEHSNYYNNWGSDRFKHRRKYAAEKSDQLVVLTERDKQNYITNLPKCKPICVIPNPVAPINIDYNISSTVIVSAGQLLPIKQFDLAIEVASEVLMKHPNWQWVICGDGPEREKLAKLIEDKNLNGKINLLGTIRDMETIYANAAIFVMTSKMEGLPMVLLEAKAHKLPIVSFDIMTGPSDIVTNAVNGFLIKPNDVMTMANKINELISNTEMRKSFSDSAYVDIDKFALDSILSKWEETFESLY